MANRCGKFTSQNRASRDLNTYDVNPYGAQKKLQGRFVLGVISDLSDGPDAFPDVVKDAAFLEVDGETVEAFQRGHACSKAFDIPDALSGDATLAVALSFEKLSDFEPDAIAARTKASLDAARGREDLSGIAALAAGSEDETGSIAQTLGALARTADTLPDHDTGAEDRSAALASLMAAAPPPEEKDTSADVLSALKAVKVDDTAVEDTSAAALDALRKVKHTEDIADTTEGTLDELRSAEVTQEPQRDDKGAALAALRAVKIEEDTEDDEAAVLDHLRDIEPDDIEAEDNTDTLERLRAEAPEEDVPEDTNAGALDALRAVELVEETAQDDAAALDALRKSAVPTQEAAPLAEDVLATLEAPETVEPGIDQEAALAGLQPPDETVVADTTQDVLAGLEPVVEDVEDTGIEAALAGLEAPEEEVIEDVTDDVLAAIEAPQTAESENAAEDVLAALEPADTPEEQEDIDATLASLEAVPETTQEDSADDILAGIDQVTDEQNNTEVEDALAGLEAVEETAADTPPDDVLATLELMDTEEDENDLDATLASLEAVPETTQEDSADDILAGIDQVTDEQNNTEVEDALAGLEAVEETAADTPPDDVLATLELMDTEEDEDDLDAMLASLEAVPETAKEDSADDILAGIDQVTDEQDNTEVEDALAGLEAVEETAADTPPDDVLATLEPMAPEENEDDLDAMLASLEPVPETPDDHAADDILGSIEQVEDPQQDETLEDILAAMPVSLDTPEPDNSSDALATLDSLETDNPVEALEAIPDALEPAAELEARLAAIPATEPDDEAGQDTAAETDDTLEALLAGLDDEPDVQASAQEDGITAQDSTPAARQDTDDRDEDLEALLAELEAEPAETLLPDEDGYTGVATEEDAELEALLSVLDEEKETEGGDPALDALLADLLADDTDEVASQTEDTQAADAELDDLMASLDADTQDDGAAPDDLDALLTGLDDDPALSGGADVGEDLDTLLAELDEPASDEDAAAQSITPSTRAAPEPQIAFGTLTGARPDPEKLERKRFRLAILGDFTGRAARGICEVGDNLASRTPILLDPDTAEDVIAGFGTTLVLPIGKDGAGVEVKLAELDDLHPDELYENVALFGALRDLKSQLGHGATAESAAQSLLAWGAAHGQPVRPASVTSGGNTLPAHLKLSDFQRLIGDTTGALAQSSPVDDLLARIVGPHIRKLPDPDAVAMAGAVDEALSAAMRLVLHHPEFQSVEAQWRAIDLIARSVETDETLDVMLYDVSAEEIAADLTQSDDLANSGLVRLLSEGPMDPETGRGAYSAVMGMYTFEETPPHAQLLARVARVAAHVDAPFIAAITPEFMGTAMKDRHPLVAAEWDKLRAMPEAGHLGLATPRFLLRRPYGAKSEPIDAFEFEEFTQTAGLSGMLWANPVVLISILLAQSFRENGPAMGLGQIMSLGDMPYHFVLDHYGDQVALPCTERNLTLDKIETVLGRGFMPVISAKGRDEIRLGSFQSLAGGEILGPWADIPPPSPAAPIEEHTQTTPEAQDDAPDPSLDEELDALLAGFDLDADGGDEAPIDDEDMDAELAALLADL